MRSQGKEYVHSPTGKKNNINFKEKKKKERKIKRKEKTQSYKQRRIIVYSYQVKRQVLKKFMYVENSSKQWDLRLGKFHCKILKELKILIINLVSEVPHTPLRTFGSPPKAGAR